MGGRGRGPVAGRPAGGGEGLLRPGRHQELLFLRRFFSNQFKRSTLPNGPKVVAGGSLSPRGDWRMPSDAGGSAWIAELERNVPPS